MSVRPVSKSTIAGHGAGIGQADRPVAVVAEGRVAVGHRGGFGQAVALDRAHAGALDERPLHRRRQRAAGAGADRDRAQVVPAMPGKWLMATSRVGTTGKMVGRCRSMVWISP